MEHYEFDIDKLNANPASAPLELIKKTKTFPNDFSMSSLRPADFASLVSRLNTTESLAVSFKK